jgi:hypothetical protein
VLAGSWQRLSLSSMSIAPGDIFNALAMASLIGCSEKYERIVMSKKSCCDRIKYPMPKRMSRNEKRGGEERRGDNIKRRVGQLTSWARADFHAVAFTKQKIEQTTQTEPLISLGAADRAEGVGKVEANCSLFRVGVDVNIDFTILIGRGVDG